MFGYPTKNIILSDLVLLTIFWCKSYTTKIDMEIIQEIKMPTDHDQSLIRLEAYVMFF